MLPGQYSGKTDTVIRLDTVIGDGSDSKQASCLVHRRQPAMQGHMFRACRTTMLCAAPLGPKLHMQLCPALPTLCCSILMTVPYCYVYGCMCCTGGIPLISSRCWLHLSRMQASSRAVLPSVSRVAVLVLLLWITVYAYCQTRNHWYGTIHSLVSVQFDRVVLFIPGCLIAKLALIHSELVPAWPTFIKTKH